MGCREIETRVGPFRAFGADLVGDLAKFFERQPVRQRWIGKIPAAILVEQVSQAGNA
jgi:hypothetical protein